MAQEIVATFTSPVIEATFGSLPIANMWEIVATQTLIAESSIAVGSAIFSIVPIVSAGGTVTLTSTPTIQTTSVGIWHIAVLVGTSETDMPKIQDESHLADSCLHLANQRDFTFGLNDTLILIFNGTKWIQLTREDGW